MQSGIIFCIIYLFVSSLPLGKARRFFSSEEVASNASHLVHQISKILQVNPENDKYKDQLNPPEIGQDKGAKEWKDYILQILQGKDSEDGEGGLAPAQEQQEDQQGDKMAMKKLQDYILSQVLGKKKPVPDQAQKQDEHGDKTVMNNLKNYMLSQVLGKNKPVANQEESPKKSSRKWAAIWDSIKNFFNKIGQAIKNPSQVQRAKKDDEYSLMQNIKSGRVRGPVHVYGQHSKEASDD